MGYIRERKKEGEKIRDRREKGKLHVNLKVKVKFPLSLAN
jgi:hypothetical protein